MEYKTLSDDQKKRLNKLLKAHMIRGMFVFFKYMAFIFVADLATVSLNVFYVRSEHFVFPITIINMIFLMHFMLQETARNRDAFDKEVRKIITEDLEAK